MIQRLFSKKPKRKGAVEGAAREDIRDDNVVERDNQSGDAGDVLECSADGAGSRADRPAAQPASRTPDSSLPANAAPLHANIFTATSGPGGNPEEGFDAIFTTTAVFDRATHRVHFIPCTKEITAVKTAQLYIDNIVRLHGLPLSIVSDRDKLFTSLFWKELTRVLRLGVQLRLSTANHPQTDGASKRKHRSLLEMLRIFVQHFSSSFQRSKVILV
jgi:hypothetical protein